ncbi:hypothetical protein AB3X85_30460, partial [Paraburkholderia phenoliruptrix]
MRNTTAGSKPGSRSGIVITRSGNVIMHSGIVIARFGNPSISDHDQPKWLITIVRNQRSRSSEILDHDRRNT